MANPTVDWAGTKVIYVPKSFLTLVQSTPTEIYDLPLNAFRLALLDLQDDPDARPWQKIYKHDTESTLGGLTYARKIEILVPYTVTFEDGQYAVNLTGANSNVADRTNVNQVSVRPQNSAGMISSPDIEYASFNGGVTYDETGSNVGTIFPIGTPRVPVNNIFDARIIALYRGFSTGYILHNMTIPVFELDGFTPFIMSGFIFYGSGKDRTKITIPDGANVSECTYLDSFVTGFLDGENTLEGCFVEDLYYIKGFVELCVLSGVGQLELGGTDTASFLGCISGEGVPIINMGGSGQPLLVEDHSGSLKIINKSGPESATIGIKMGTIVIDTATVTNGIFKIEGTGDLEDQNGDPIFSGIYGDLVIVNNLTNKTEITKAVWDTILTGATHNIPTSAGRRLRDMASIIIHSDTAEGSGIGNNQIEFNGNASTVNGAYDPAMISLVGGTGVGQTRLVLQYNGATKIATVDRNWKVNPDNTSQFVISAHPGREHVNEGLAQGGTINTITLNALASSEDNTYVGQAVFIRSGTGEDQACKIIAYDGTTKVATTCKQWAIIPDTTSGYVMLPSGYFNAVTLSGLIADTVWNGITLEKP